MHTRICTLEQGRAALNKAAVDGVAAQLESPAGAAITYGVLWFAELNRMLAAEFPTLGFALILDCGNRADLAHAALVEGIKHIRFQGHDDARRALRDIAAQLGAEVRE